MFLLTNDPGVYSIAHARSVLFVLDHRFNEESYIPYSSVEQGRNQGSIE